MATNNAHHNTIGGATDAHRNIISGEFAGIDIEDSITNNFTIQNNWIGLGADGSTVLGSGDYGIYLYSGDNHVIGGVGTGNVILGSGVGIGFTVEVDGTTVQGNFIGIDETGTIVAGNDVGIEIAWGSSGNVIGGVNAGEGNVITASTGAGISVLSSSSPVNNSIRGNAIYDNDGLGIDLHNDGVTANDAGDADMGANNLQNWAVLTSAAIADDGTFSYQLDTTTLAAGTYTVDFYASTNRDGGQVEGKRYLGSLSGVANGNSSLTGSLSGISLASGEYVTLVTTDANGNSSEFSNYAVATDSDPGGATPSDLQAVTTSEGGLSINADGGNDIYLKADDGGAILGGLTDFTVEIQLAIGSPLTDTPLLSYATAGAENEVMLWLNSSGTLQLKINDYSGNSSTVSSTVSSADFDDGLPHTISATWSSATGDWVIYLDGVDVGSGTGFVTGHTIESGGILVLGQDQDSVGGGFDSAQHFAGTYYDVRVFDDVRSAGEIAASYRSDLPFDEAGMIANWRFDQLSTDGVVIDAVSGNNLTVKHVNGAGFTASEPSLTFTLNENALAGTVVGQVSGVDAEREARIAQVLAADPDLRYNAETGSFYKVVTSGAMDKNAALSIVSSTTLNGVVGTLPTVTSANENEFLRQLVSLTGTSSAWLSGSDAAVADEWRWADGTLFWVGDASGYRVDGQYVNFSATEPNGGTNTSITSLSLSGSTGEWKDSSAFLLNTGLIIEYNADEVLDATNALTYSIQSQTVAGAFAISSDTGEITVADGSFAGLRNQRDSHADDPPHGCRQHLRRSLHHLAE
ncbi:MAG: LamG-like jellyroll fold domain-containing protein [Planctomycetaceae bacterium]